MTLDFLGYMTLWVYFVQNNKPIGKKGPYSCQYGLGHNIAKSGLDGSILTPGVLALGAPVEPGGWFVGRPCLTDVPVGFLVAAFRAFDTGLREGI